MKNAVLAADLGGTNLRMAAVDERGEVLFRGKIPTPKPGTCDAITGAIKSLADDCREAVRGIADIKAVGIAAAAVMSSSDKTISRAPNLPELDGTDLGASVEKALALPVFMENDATAAAIGEHWLGASRGFASSICVTLGTGVGGGIILNGKPLRGIDGTAGEVGHICVEPLGAPCGCGSFGCLEQYSSASAIVRIARELSAGYPDTTLDLNTRITPLDVFNAGKSGDELALEVFRRTAYYLGIGLAGLINVLNPEVIVIGGGAAAGWDLFIDHLHREIEKRAFKQPTERARIVRATLGDDAGILGAARIAFEYNASTG